MKKELSKIALSISILVGVLFSALASPAAGPTILYTEDWGTTNAGISGSYALNVTYGDAPFTTVGWSIVVPAAQSGTGPPYEGIFVASGAEDAATGGTLPANTVYYTTQAAGQNAFFYTTAGAGNGGGGDSAFPAGGINPAAYPGLTFNVEVRGNPAVPNFFAVQLNGSSWYVSTTPLTGGTPAIYPQFTNTCLPYTTTASAWDTLSFTANTVTIGPVAGADLSGTITGIGIVQLPPGGWNYNELVISTTCAGNGVLAPVSILAPPISQAVYVGGGFSFAIATAGSFPITYNWYQNGNLLTDGGRISGSATGTLTITNANDSDGTATYSVVVGNGLGASATTLTNSGFTVTVTDPVPSDDLYVETVPFTGPVTGEDDTLASIGWVSAVPDNTGRIWYNSGGQGVMWAWEPSAMTTAFYTTTSTDTNQSGLAFTNINPANYPRVGLQAAMQPSGTGDNAYFAVQMNGSSWYVTTTNIPLDLTASGFQNVGFQFTYNQSSWNNLTITATNAVIGSGASSPLSGSITGAGLVFVTLGNNGNFNTEEFAVTTDVEAQPPSIGYYRVPNDQTVYSGGGVSFAVGTTTGSVPFTYGWTLNGNALNDGTLSDGAIISGSHTSEVTIRAITTAENGNVIAYVTNDYGWDESDNWGGTTLTVVNPPIGTIYTEAFPFVGPVAANNYPIGSVGWSEAVNSGPWSLFNNPPPDGAGAVFAYQAGTAATTAYYTSTNMDTNQSGLPFPNIVLAGYENLTPPLTLSADLIASSRNAGDGYALTGVEAFFVVQVGGVWYRSVNYLPVGWSWGTYTQVFSPAKANWEVLIINEFGTADGGPALNDLTGVMTGAGLAFTYDSSGGDDNFANFTISGTGLGGINVGPLTGNPTLNLSWVGNPAVNLQSATILSPNLIGGGNWLDVPNTAGKYSLTVTNTGPQKFYRLIQHVVQPD